MKTVLMLSGLPASGKSTYAKKLVGSGADWGRVNRDNLREMIFNGKWSGHKEATIIDAEKAVAEAILQGNRHVVIDDTNLSPKHLALWSIFAVQKNARFERKHFDTSLEECIKRDAVRDNSVGANVIRTMAAKNGLIDWGTKPIVIVDIDGTLARNSDERLALLKSDPKDWDGYFRGLMDDEPIIPIFEMVSKLYQEGNSIILVSGRPSTYYWDTLCWFDNVWAPKPLFPELEVPKFKIDHIFMRSWPDKRPDTIVKQEILDFLPKSQIVLVVDDRPRVLRMWEENGLKTFAARGWDIEDF